MPEGTGPAPRARPGVHRVALLTPGRGPSGMFGLACRAAAELAAREVTDRGGVRGRALEFAHVDAGAPPRTVAAQVRALLDAGSVEGVTGWHLSSVREAVAPVVAGRVPYVYATAYEGGDGRAGLVCTGELPEQQVVAALAWLHRELGMSSWAVVGDDYVWPRRTAARVAATLRGHGVRLRGRHWVPLGCADEQVWRRVVTAVGREDVDGVVMLLVGADGVRFNREFAGAGLDARFARFSPFMDETMLLASGPGATRGLYAAAGWFADLASGSAMEFSRGFTTTFDAVAADPSATGPGAPPPGTMAETTYSAVHLLADLGRRSADPRAAAAEALRVRHDGWMETPHGAVRLRSGRADHPVHLAVADGTGFDVLARVSGRRA
ncbi:ABC transporter substrate-binding protein [Kineococcus sp. SYSU DK004]|uniref:ABC transporter substrate-binding protein n=1 Tax=Kineococcus sp. SYSU DK004 TaxID=3383125 RepID=UPI003D7F0610